MTDAADARSVIRAKRDGLALDAAQIDAFVRGLVDRSWDDAQAAALAMAIVCRGMDAAETVALTRAMTASGSRLDWRDAGLAGPFLDKHSTGGVGDKVSLLLAPVVAACGGVVPMISGRGLAHTGGTLDKLESLHGYEVNPPRERLLRALREAGCAIVGADASLAPADRRLYAIRDVTATVESLPLIVASILSKKLAAGLDALVLDVKAGSGGFLPTRAAARELARALVDVARGAGLPARALVTDMGSVLGRHAGHALEVQECLQCLRGERVDARLAQGTVALSAELLRLGGLCADPAQAQRQAQAALDGGQAAERFARMVAALGGPSDVFATAWPAAPVCRPLPAPADGRLAALDARTVGEVVVALGGGRRRLGDAIDPRVGVAEVRPVGAAVVRGEPLLWVHAATPADAEAALSRLADAVRLSPEAAEPPLVVETVD